MIVDTAQVVSLTLRSLSVVTSAVTDSMGTHIYGPPGLPTGFELRKAIIYLSNGGLAQTDVPIDLEMFQFTCYGHTSQEARQVYRALRSGLHRLSRVRIPLDGQYVMVQYARQASGPTDMEEPELGWPFVYCTYQWHIVESYLT